MEVGIHVAGIWWDMNRNGALIIQHFIHLVSEVSFAEEVRI